MSFRVRRGRTDVVDSILLGTADPARLRAWYCEALQTEPDQCGFIDVGGLRVLIDGRADVEDTNPEPSRVALSLYVDDALALVARFETIGAALLPAPPGSEPGTLGVVTDPDGNRLQIVQLENGRQAAS